MDNDRKHTHCFSTMPARQLTVCICVAFFLNLAGCLTDSSSESDTPASISSSSISSISVSSSSSQPKDDSTKSLLTIDGISLLVDSSFFMDKFHSSSIKIAFKDEETNELNYIEINGNKIQHEIIATSATPDHPQFSPDGSKLAFSTGAEGIFEPSDLYVIDLSSADRPIQKLEAEIAAIPRWRVTENGDTSILYNDYVGSDLSPLWSYSGTFIVSYSNNTCGTPLKLFNRSYNGGVSADNSLAVSGSPQLLFHYASDDDSVNIDMYNEDQACNVSMPRDSSKIISFLETQGSMGLQFTQSMSYNWHQYLFYMDSTGKILKAIKSESGYVFNGTEWLYAPGYQIGVLTSTDGESEHIILIDYEHDSYYTIAIAPGKQIAYPDLWVNLGNSNF